MTLPTIPGMHLLSELGHDAFTRRYRVLGQGPEILVLFHDAAAGRLVLPLAEALRDAPAAGVAPIRRVLTVEGQVGLLLAADTGESPWRQQPFGELAAMPLVRQAAAAVAALLRSPLRGHGALQQDGLELLPGGVVQLLPPLVSEPWLCEALGRPLPGQERPAGTVPLTPPARDLAALADLACHLIAGVRLAGLDRSDHVVAELARCASPITVQAVRVLLGTAARACPPEAAVQALARVGWVDEAPAVERRVARAQPAGNAAKADDEASPVRRRRPRLPIATLAAVAVAGGAFFVLGGPQMVSGVLSRGAREDLPDPQDPMARSGGRGPIALAPPTEPAAPAGTALASAAPIEEADPAAIADAIQKRLAELREPKAVQPAKPSYDKSLLDEGDRLRDEAKAHLRQVVDREVHGADRQARLEQAISLLEQARTLYQDFAQRYPGKEALVEGTMEDVNALLRIAYKSRSH